MRWSPEITIKLSPHFGKNKNKNKKEIKKMPIETTVISSNFPQYFSRYFTIFCWWLQWWYFYFLCQKCFEMNENFKTTLPGEKATCTLFVWNFSYKIGWRESFHFMYINCYVKLHVNCSTVVFKILLLQPGNNRSTGN